MRATCVVGVVEYSDTIIPREILERFHLTYYYKNIEDITQFYVYKPIEKIVNSVKSRIYKPELTHELIVYGYEIPVINMIHEAEDGYYEYELAEIYVKKFTEFCFNKFNIEFESPCEYLCVCGDDMDLLFLNSKQINEKIDNNFDNYEYDTMEILRIEIILKEEYLAQNAEIGAIENLNKEIILLIAKSKYSFISNTSTANEGDMILSFYLENRKDCEELVMDMSSSIESISSEQDEGCRVEKCEMKWFKFVKRKIKKKHHFIENMSIKKV